MAEPKQNGFDNLPIAGKLFLLVLLLGVVTAIYYFAFHMQLTEDLELAEQQHEQLQEDLREAERRQEEYLRLTQELASREAIDRQNKRVLPEQAEIAAFLQDLNRVAELSGLEMKLVEPRPEEAAELYTRIPVQLEVAGRFHQLAKFFFNVSRLERAINMENIVLVDPQVSDADGVMLAVRVLATTFRSNAEESSAPANANANRRGNR